MKAQNLIEYLESISFESIKDHLFTWKELSIKYGDTNDESWARKAWSRHVKRKYSTPNYWRNTDLEKVQTITVDGEPKFEKYKKEINPNSFLENGDLEGLGLEAVTTNPYGGSWKKYKAIPWSLTQEQVGNLVKQARVSTITPVKPNYSKIAVVDIADIHIGLLHILGNETLRKPDYSLAAVEHYLELIAGGINAQKFSEVHFHFPGDLAESFTGKNHKDTWKHLELYKQNIIIVIFETLSKFIDSVDNVVSLSFIEGNHDRLTSKFETNSRKGLSEIIAYMLQMNTNYSVDYHPMLLSQEIDGINHIITHGDWKIWKDIKTRKADYGTFLFKFGKKDMFNILKTGHYHAAYSVIRQGSDFIHYQCSGLSTGNLYEEALGVDHVPGYTIVTQEFGLPSIQFKPLKLYRNDN